MRTNFGAFRCRRAVAAIAVACALAGFAVPTLARPHPHVTGAASSESLRHFSVSGTVADVDYAANVVDIETSGGRTQIVVTPTTAIEYRGEVGGIADIHRGRKINASGVVRDDSKIAESVVLH